MWKREGKISGLTWFGRLAVMGGVAALTPLVSIRAQPPKSEVANPTTIEVKKEVRKGSDAGEREAIEKARDKVEELEEAAEAKYTEFKKAVRHLERAEARLAELQAQAGRPAPGAPQGFRGGGVDFGAGAARNRPNEGADGFETHGFGMPPEGMHGFGMAPGGMHGMGMHGMGMHGMGMHGMGMEIGWLREIDEKLNWLHDEIKELRGARDEGAPKGKAQPARESSPTEGNDPPARRKSARRPLD